MSDNGLISQRGAAGKKNHFTITVTGHGGGLVRRITLLSL